MKAVKTITIPAALVGFAILCSVAHAEADTPSNIERLSLPSGNVEDGRVAFMELKCNTCHAVAGDNTMPKPVAEKPAPVFGVRQSRYKANFLADSIIFPSHAILPGSHGRDGKKDLSRMGDFSDAMTVRQLTDIVAYLKSLDNEV